MDWKTNHNRVIRTSSTLSSQSSHDDNDEDEMIATLPEDNQETENTQNDVVDFDWKPHKVKKNLFLASRWNQGSENTGKNRRFWDVDFCRMAFQDYQNHLEFVLENRQNNTKREEEHTSLLWKPNVCKRALQVLLKCNHDTPVLSQRVRELEKTWGLIGNIPMTDDLSCTLLKVHGKAGNVGRTLHILQSRLTVTPPHPQEMQWAVQSIVSAGLRLRRNERNLWLRETQQPALDNPTRWLDAILMHMHQRKIPLTKGLANQMLHTFCTTGKTGRALHHFYTVKQQKQQKQKNDNNDNNVNYSDDDSSCSSPLVRIKWKRPPKYYKIPSQAKGNVFDHFGNRLEYEQQADFSITLNAAYAFLESLQQGACGHAPLTPDIVSYNTLLKTCCHRGALWRAMHLLDNVMPEKDAISYNTVLEGLARVGDVETMRKYFLEMTNGKDVNVDAFTIQPMVDGMLNVGNVSGAITFVQDVFNQYTVLPPYTTHLKILEVALASELEYEAKRHVYFLQQLWKWQPTQYHSPEETEKVQLAQRNPKLSKEALQHLFRYFGYTLADSDFF